MIHGTGIDIIELDRVTHIIQTQEKFVAKILTERERAIYHSLSERRKVEYVAGRFAVKEAVSKALGTGIGKEFSWHHISVLSQEQGAPNIKWEKVDSPYADTSYKYHVSISHSHTNAIAQVIIEKK